jgi:GNAT superfamily N-acetyltransferase
MHRAPEPRSAILLRANDRAAGALFVGVHRDLAVTHLVLTLPGFRRQGVGLLGLRHAAIWAAANGADTLALPVEADNAPALALYARAGLTRVGGYRYWSMP